MCSFFLSKRVKPLVSSGKLKAKVIHLETNSGGAGKPRNVGIENSTGKYIAFIDSDDMITEDYISLIKYKIK